MKLLLKYTIALILIILLVQKTFSQTQNILWDKEKFEVFLDGQKVLIPSFKNAVFLHDNQTVPYLKLYFDDEVNSIQIENETYEALNDYQLKISSKLDVIIETGIQRSKYISNVYVPCIRQNPKTQQLEKLISFDYKIIKNSSSSIQRSKIDLSSTLNSVLAKGDWYKMSFINSGVYKIDYSTLKSWGIDVDNINPRYIGIYGNGAKMLPQKNSESRVDDLQENFIKVIGQEDGKFDSYDYILFYVQGSQTWNYKNVNKIYIHTNNLYTDTSHYFLTINTDSEGLRVSEFDASKLTKNPIMFFDERIAYEKDEENILKSGRIWYCKSMNLYNNFQYNLNLNIEDCVIDSIIRLNSKVMGKSLGSTNGLLNFNLNLNGRALGFQKVNESGSQPYTQVGRENSTIFEIKPSEFNLSNQFNLNYKFTRNLEQSAIGFLDFATICYKRKLRFNTNQLHFRNSNDLNNELGTYSISLLNKNQPFMLWNITNPLHPQQYKYIISNDSAIFEYLTDYKINEFVVFNPNYLPVPLNAIKIQNQNLHALKSSNLLIITHPLFLNAAKKLADFRKINDKLSVEIVNVFDIYNEFSSGNQDVTAIRDFVRNLYFKSSKSEDSLKYLLLMGDCSYDYKNIIKNNTNYIPIYESVNSLHPVKSFSSDDYFGFMDDNEGAWEEFPADYHYLDIGIGRIPCNTEENANQVVNKIINYSNKSLSFQPWKNQITLVADAGDLNQFFYSAEELSKKIETISPTSNLLKIYLDAYQFLTLPDGTIVPDAVSALNESLENGTLLFNYIGHGGTAQLSVKRIVNISQILNLNNYNNLPFWLTATCEFSTYDDPEITSAGEWVLMASNGGGVGLLTTTRPVYLNSEINNAYFDVVFKKVNGKYPRLGDITMYTKNRSINDVVNRNYALLGDPSLQLNYAENKVTITSINNKDISAIDTLSALEKVTIKGQINDIDNVKMNNFKGTVYVKFFDKKINISTLTQDGSKELPFTIFNNTIYSGQASVINGEFSITFVVPKDIAYQIGTGKLSLYAKEDNHNSDASGYLNVLVGGSSKDNLVDNTPPYIKLFMNDESFVNGGLVNNNPKLIALFSDSNGVNISSSGIGHELFAVLNNEKNNQIVLNKYYTSNKDDYTKGRVEYKLNLKDNGYQTITVKAWDVANNSAESSLDFIVANSAKIALEHVLNYPNPFTTNTQFHFDHNRAGDDLQVQIQIFTVAGNLVKTLQSELQISQTHFSNITWDGKDDFGDKLAKGVYVYKISVRSKRDGSETHNYEKLVLLN